MNRNLYISAFLDKPGLLENMVEKLAQKHNDAGYCKSKVPKPWKALETSSTETFVSGTVEFQYNQKELIRMPFASSFLFTCIKECNEEYKLSWSASLS